MERFGSKAARLIWEGRPDKAARRALPSILHPKVAAQMDTILNTANLKDCSNYPPGWRFKALSGKLQGTYQVRVDVRYRIRFRWDVERGAVGIVVGDFHDQDE